jgi:hypothetical protein
MKFLDEWREKREARKAQALKEKEEAERKAEAAAAEKERQEKKKALAMTMTQHVANKAVESVQSKHKLTDSDVQVLFNVVLNAPFGSTQAVDHYWPSRLEIPCAYVAQVLLECSKFSSASPEQIRQAHGDCTKDDLLEAVDFVLATSLMMVEAMLKKPSYRDLLDKHQVKSLLKNLVPDGCGSMTKRSLATLKAQLSI